MSTLALTQAPHATFYNGGEGPTTRQNFARITHGRTPHGPRIDAAVDGIQPGELRPVLLDNAGLLFGVRRPDRSGAYLVIDWTPKNIFDQQTQQVIHFGRRIRNKVIAYADATGEWREEAMPAALGRATGSGHGYGVIAQDGAGKVYISGHQLDPSSWTWRAMPNHILTNGGSGSMMEYMPNALGGRGGIVKYGGSVRRFLMFDIDAWEWSFHVDGLPCGQHALIEYHQAHGNLLMVGGTDTSTVAALVDENGASTIVAPCPAAISMTDSWISRHPSGCWLVRNKTLGLFAYWPLEDRWDSLGPSPDAALKNATISRDDSRGVLFITHDGGLSVMAYPAL